MNCLDTTPPPAITSDDEVASYFRSHGVSDCLRLCQELPQGSWPWYCAVVRLEKFNVSAVEPYITQLVQNPSPAVRQACYSYGRRAGIPYLRPFAETDLSNDLIGVLIPNANQNELSLSWHAQSYLYSLAGQQVGNALPGR